MILIFTTSDDPSSNEVVRELVRRGEKVARLNQDDDVSSLSLTADNAGWEIQSGDLRIDSREVKSVWYRKGSFWFDQMFTCGESGAPTSLNKILASRLEQESSVMRGYFHSMLSSGGARLLGHAQIGDLNKLVVCRLAQSVGLKVPDYLVSNARERAIEFVRQGSTISKATSDGLFAWDYEVTQRAYFSYTELVTEDDVSGIKLGRTPTYLQRCVDKAYEVRSFFLDGEFFSCAILSQEDTMTSIDYRKYNGLRPTRKIPVVLPEDTANQTRALFSQLKLNTGSVDFMVDHTGAYHFLEVNPSGQFGAISNACGFDLHQHVASWLSGRGISNA